MMLCLYIAYTYTLSVTVSIIAYLFTHIPRSTYCAHATTNRIVFRARHRMVAQLCRSQAHQVLIMGEVSDGNATQPKKNTTRKSSIPAPKSRLRMKMRMMRGDLLAVCLCVFVSFASRYVTQLV